ncbi:MAG: hypothetical protein AAB728_01050 [Patescibacteria group bacterium]
MPTKKRRLNITLPAHTALFLKKIALRDDVPEATKARDLLEMALELEEDKYFSALADRIEKKIRKTKNHRWMSHQEFWSRLL